VEPLLNQKQVAIGLLDAKAQELIVGAKLLYAAVMAHGKASIKAQEDLNKQATSIAHRVQVVAKQEQGLQGKEEEVAGTLECGRRELSSREAGLNAREATLEKEQ
jgi:hypothetical protein